MLGFRRVGDCNEGGTKLGEKREGGTQERIENKKKPNFSRMNQAKKNEANLPTFKQ